MKKRQMTCLTGEQPIPAGVSAPAWAKVTFVPVLAPSPAAKLMTGSHF
jgi:hypothetical protein